MVQKEFVCGSKKLVQGYLQNTLLPPVPLEIPLVGLLNFSTALVNDQFPPAMCTPQKEWFKRTRSFLDVYACV
jgi:hypothetical protein